MARGHSVRLLQVTDMHLQQDPTTLMRGENVERRFQHVMQHIEGEAADLLLLTGDLTHHAPAAYDRLALSLQGLPFPSCWLPGNHDLIDEMARFSALGYNRKVVEQGAWRVILLDSTASPDGKGGGSLANEELAFFAQQLAQTASDQHVLVALHHHPVPVKSEWMDNIGLGNKNDFWALVDSCPQVKGVVCGHVHHAVQQQRGAVNVLASPATAPQFKPFSAVATTEDDLRFTGPAYRRIQLYDDGEIQSDVVRLTS